MNTFTFSAKLINATEFAVVEVSEQSVRAGFGASIEEAKRSMKDRAVAHPRDLMSEWEDVSFTDLEYRGSYCPVMGALIAGYGDGDCCAEVDSWVEL